MSRVLDVFLKKDECGLTWRSQTAFSRSGAVGLGDRYNIQMRGF